MGTLNKIFILCFVLYLIVAEHIHALPNKANESDIGSLRSSRSLVDQHAIHKYTLAYAGAAIYYRTFDLLGRRKLSGDLIPYSIPEDPQDNKTDDEDFLRSNLIKNNVKSLEAPIEYCHITRRRGKRQVPGHTRFNDIIDHLYAAINDPNRVDYHRLPVRAWNSLNSPFTEVIGRLDSDRNDFPIILPAYIRAEIHSNHVEFARSNPRPNIPQHIYDYLDLVGRNIGQGNRDARADDAGHLLAHSLGGSSDDQFNFSPQTARLNRHADDNTYSIWLGEEIAMAAFLATPNRRIVWEVLVEYPQPTTTGQYRLRPIAFCLRHRNYNELGQAVDNRNRRITNAEPVMCFSNDPDEECLYDEW